MSFHFNPQKKMTTSQNISNKIFLYQLPALAISSSVFLAISSPIFAGPQSTNFELKTYDFGNGGTQETSSTNYSMQGEAGSQDKTKSSGTNYNLNSGLTFSNQANVPAAPTVSNPAQNYDRLKIVLNNGNNPSDATFAIAISPDNFTTTYYVQSDNTIGTSLGTEDWQTYTTWGGATGFFAKTLKQNTTYTVKVKARSGKYSETEWSQTGSAVTSTPSLTFSISLSSLTFDNLNAGNSYTDNSKSTVLTTSTNAAYGYVIYGHETGPLTSGLNTIPDYSSPNSAPTSWSGYGFGYTTSDNDLTGGTNNRFASGTKYAGFTTSTPGDPIADHTTLTEGTSISNEQFTISYKVAANPNTFAGAYTNKIIYVIVPSY